MCLAIVEFTLWILVGSLIVLGDLFSVDFHEPVCFTESGKGREGWDRDAN